MRKLLYTLLVSLFVFACSEAELDNYDGTNNIQFVNSSVDYYWSAALNPDADYDTCWVSLQAMGRATDYDREIKLEQIIAEDYDLVYDHVGNVVDTTYYVLPYQAEPNIHYVPFDNEGLKKYMKLPAGAFTTIIPVVMRRNINATHNVLLRVKMLATDKTLVGISSTCSITINN